LVREGIIKPKPQARYVIQHCEYDYTTNTPMSLVLQDNFLLATHYDGKPITPEHGYLLRGLVGTFADRIQQNREDSLTVHL